MSKNVQLRVGTTDEMGQRFVDAWKRAEAGEEVNESHLTFIGLDTLLATLTSKRLDLLRHVHRNGALTVKALADMLGRDYKNVHTDVAALEEAGLLVRDGRKVAAPWDELQASISLQWPDAGNHWRVVLPPKTPNYILRFTYIGDALRYVRLRGMTLTSIIGLRSVVIFLQLVHQPRMVCGISQFIGGSCPIRMIAVGDMRSGVIFLSTETGPSID